MNKVSKKIVLIGCGAVGSSFLYSAMNKGIASRYEIIDAFKQVAEGNVLDFEDVISSSHNSFSVAMGDYKKCKDADVIVITAGRPQREGETRLDLMVDNAKIMKAIALEVKKSGFQGVTIIASNPVDIMTCVYKEVTKFPKNRVISSGTSLDSARLKFEIAKRINVSPKSIDAYVLGEHGDSSVSIFSSASVCAIPLSTFAEEKLIDPKEYPKMHETVWKKAYEIIEKKRVTCYGIGSNLSDLAECVINDYNEVKVIGAYLEGEYGLRGSYVGVPAIIGRDGIKKILEIDLNKAEKEKFEKSFKILKENTNKVLKTL